MDAAKSSLWCLTDWYGSKFSDFIYPKTYIATVEQLGTALESFVGQDPRFVKLESPGDLSIWLAIGGPFGGVSASGTGVGNHSLAAVANPPYTTEFHCFVGEWQPSYYPPKYLFPPAEVVRITLELFNTRKLPQWVSWEG